MFCPHCHNKIPDGSNFCPLCYANLVGVKQQEKESEAETDAPRPKQKPAPRKNNAKPAYTKGSRQSKRAQDKTPMIIAIGLILILVLIIVMIVRSMFGAGAPTVVNTPVPQATQQPQQENNFIVFGATNTPAPQLTATPNIEITPTPAPQAPAVTTYKTLRKGDRGKSVISMQEALIKLGYLKGASDGNFGTGTKSALMDFQSAAGLKVTGVADVDTQEALEASDAPEKGGVTLKQGMSGDAVKRLQNRLIELGYMTGTADGSFGASTKTAVAAFQRKAGLDADGIAGPTTLAVLYDADAPSATPTDDTLEQGDSGDAVKALQKRLIELGYMNGTADGDFGSATKAAVKLFQKQAGLTVDGVAGPGTQSALLSSNAPKYDGKTSVDTDTSSTAAKIIATAKQYMGCTYVYGTSGPNTFDCSGFTCFVFKKYGYSLLRSAQQQGYDDNYERLTRSELKMGDIVCFNTISDNDLSDHVGIYISDGNFIHASSGGGCVMISNLDSGYYNRVFSWGRRILD